ncbi:hypothetical protein BGZ83_009513 [Gryganskiella cystojenkinii]|nr:hypothetical protein BGZ83_009513 [Gryganskiella cystojenkinii]
MAGWSDEVVDYIGIVLIVILLPTFVYAIWGKPFLHRYLRASLIIGLALVMFSLATAYEICKGAIPEYGSGPIAGYMGGILSLFMFVEAGLSLWAGPLNKPVVNPAPAAFANAAPAVGAPAAPAVASQAGTFSTEGSKSASYNQRTKQAANLSLLERLLNLPKIDWSRFAMSPLERRQAESVSYGDP